MVNTIATAGYSDTKELAFKLAVTDETGENRRLVFIIGDNVAVVVKTFGDGAKPVTCKIWDLSKSSLEKTMSYWSTKKVFEPSPAERQQALDVLERLVSIVHSAIQPA